LQRGDPNSGVILLKISNTQGSCRLVIQERNSKGALVWVDALNADVIEEARADAYIIRARDRDPDLWVIEVEERELTNFTLDNFT
jgi:hypothetical protein